MNVAGWKAIKAESENVGWPQMYKDDLDYHDFCALASPHSPQRFGWIVRATGTWLLWEKSERARHIVDHTVRHGIPSFFYFFDGKKLLQVTPQELLHEIYA